MFDRPVGERVAARVTVTDAANPAVRFEGDQQGGNRRHERPLVLSIAQAAHLRDRGASAIANRHRQYYTAGTNAEDRLTIFLSGIPAVPRPPQAAYTPPPITKPLAPKDEARLKRRSTAFFTAPTNQQAAWKFSGAAWKSCCAKMNPPCAGQPGRPSAPRPIHAALRQDFDARQVRFEKHLSPYTVKTVGTRPTNGWALFIAMHGGGGAPQELNDSQWRHMQNYYRDHPEGGRIPLCGVARARTTTWNGFYTGYVYPLIQNLLRQFLLFGDVDPNKLFLMGYSHGGYGAFAIGPKMPDRFAAIHASAAAPADGAGPITLRNTRLHLHGRREGHDVRPLRPHPGIRAGNPEAARRPDRHLSGHGLRSSPTTRTPGCPTATRLRKCIPPCAIPCPAN